MLEIILLIALTRRVGHIVEQKGRKSGWYKLLTVVLWFGGEIAGGIVGAVVVAVSGVNELLIYLIALIGAAVGAGVAFLIAKGVTPAGAAYIPPPPPPPPPSTFT